jgi:hypothetical protein
MAHPAGNSGFRWYVFGSVSSDFGTWLQNTAQVLLGQAFTFALPARNVTVQRLVPPDKLTAASSCC